MRSTIFMKTVVTRHLSCSEVCCTGLDVWRRSSLNGNPHEAESNMQSLKPTAPLPPGGKSARMPPSNGGNKKIWSAEVCEGIIAAFSLIDISLDLQPGAFPTSRWNGEEMALSARWEWWDGQVNCGRSHSSTAGVGGGLTDDVFPRPLYGRTTAPGVWRGADVSCAFDRFRFFDI